MTGVEFIFKFPDWAEKVKRRMNEINLFLAAQIQFNRGMLFDQEGAYNGRPRWRELAFRNGQILSNRGVLRKSIAPLNPKGREGPDGIVRIAGDFITVGTKVLYARLMNDGTTKMPGGKMVAKNGKALMIPLPNGKAASPLAKTLRKTESSTLLTPKPGGGYSKSNVIFRKSVKIPARPFDTWNKEDQEEIDAGLINKLVQVMNEP